MAATAEAQSALREQLLAEQEQSVREAFQRHRLAAPATCSHCDYPGMCISAADSFVVDKQGLSLPPLVPLEPLLPIGATELLQARAARTAPSAWERQTCRRLETLPPRTPPCSQPR